jgi:hypothetical protein
VAVSTLLPGERRCAAIATIVGGGDSESVVKDEGTDVGATVGGERCADPFPLVPPGVEAGGAEGSGRVRRGGATGAGSGLLDEVDAVAEAGCGCCAGAGASLVDEVTVGAALGIGVGVELESAADGAPPTTRVPTASCGITSTQPG